MSVLLHDMTDDTPDDATIELPDGTFIKAYVYRARVRLAAKKAQAAIEQARKERRQRGYIDKALF